MKTLHEEVCEAPICAGDTTENWKVNVLWYPGEAVCNLKGQKFQKNQRRINKYVAKGIFKHLDRYFTATSLEKIGRITSSTKGKKS